MSDTADQILVENTLRGDELAFAELFKRYQSSVWRTVRRRLGDRFESEDAMQEIFLRAFTSLPKFDLGRPFDRWIMRIAKNYCIDALRRRRLRRPWLCADIEESPAAPASYCPAQPARWTSQELNQMARRLLQALKPPNRHAFILRELKGLEYSEVGKALQISPLAARVRVSRARKEMYRNLRPYLPPGVMCCTTE